MKPKLQNIFDFSTSGWETPPAESLKHNFSMTVNVVIGFDGTVDKWEYMLNICTPRWLEHNGQHSGPIWGRHLLIVNFFNPKEIRDAIEEMVAKCESNTLEKIHEKLCRYFAWEYEDYQLEAPPSMP